jgi:opacity protein-like surface antigen
VVLGEYTRLPQDYSQTDDGTALDSTTDQVDDTKFTSFGGGAGINWTPSDKVLVNTLVTVVFGEGEWVAEAPGAGNRPGDTLDWVTLRGVIDGEFTIARWLLLRGGLGAGLSWAAEKQGVDTGLVESEDKSFTFFPSAAAGLGIKIKDPVSLDFVLNLNNFTTGAPFGALSTRASIKVDF